MSDRGVIRHGKSERSWFSSLMLGLVVLSLGYLLLAAWKTGARVAGVDLEADHPDRAVVRLMRSVAALECL